MCAYVAANTGWTFETILDQMTFPRLDALKAEWKIRPPAHWLIAEYLGYRPTEEKSYMTPDAARDFLARTGGKIPGVQSL